MDYQQVQSSTIEAIGFDPGARILGVRFLNGTEYQYLNVPEEVFMKLRSAESIGKALNQLVKRGGYAYQQMPPRA